MNFRNDLARFGFANDGPTSGPLFRYIRFAEICQEHKQGRAENSDRHNDKEYGLGPCDPERRRDQGEDEAAHCDRGGSEAPDNFQCLP